MMIKIMVSADNNIQHMMTPISVNTPNNYNYYYPCFIEKMKHQKDLKACPGHNLMMWQS